MEIDTGKGKVGAVLSYTSEESPSRVESDLTLSNDTTDTLQNQQYNMSNPVKKEKRLHNFACKAYNNSSEAGVYGDDLQSFSSRTDKHQPPETCDDIYDQLKNNGYSAGEDYFVDTAFSISDEDVKLINYFLDSDAAIISKDDKAHRGEKSFYTAMGMVHGMTKLDSRSEIILPHKIKETYRVMLEAVSEYIDESMMTCEICLYKNESLTKDAIGFHMDRWLKKDYYPNYLFFGVLWSENKNSEQVPKLRLGYIHEKYEKDYGADSFENGTTCYEALYGRESTEDEALNIINNGEVEFLFDLKNCAGSGYIINQSKVLHGGRLIVHSRDEEVSNDKKSRISLIVRMCIVDKKNDTKNLYKTVIEHNFFKNMSLRQFRVCVRKPPSVVIITCSVCNKGFFRIKELGNHLKEHCKCGICKIMFKRTGTLLKHAKQHLRLESSELLHDFSLRRSNHLRAV
ncbi:MAG: hypothetical protein KAG53_07525 [Endozoicomonadaceae bacterium]|nr:hypothetical protein [Endozoicomonadaceae bacterium]